MYLFEENWHDTVVRKPDGTYVGTILRLNDWSDEYRKFHKADGTILDSVPEDILKVYNALIEAECAEFIAQSLLFHEEY